MSFLSAPGDTWREHPDEQPSVLAQFDMTGKVALVTGGCGWLGTAFSLALAEAGATVVVTSRDLDKAKEFAKTLPTPKGQAHAAVVLDHTEEASLKQGFSDAVQAAGRLDVLINNGHAGSGLDINTGNFDDFHRVQKNSAGYLFLGRELKDHCAARGATGCIVNIGSMYGQVASYPEVYPPGAASPASYHCLKGGLIHMTRHMAAYWADARIRVNCLSPGPFPSPKAPDELKAALCIEITISLVCLI